MAGESNKVNNLPERIAGLEVKVDGMAKAVGQLAAAVEEQGKQVHNRIDGLEQQDRKRGRLDPAWVAVGLTFAAMVVAGAYTYIGLQQEIMGLQIAQTQNLADLKIARVRGDVQWSADLDNQVRARQEQINGLLWERCYGESLPPFHIVRGGPVESGR